MMMLTTFSPQIIEASQDCHFREEETDFVWILNTDDYLGETVPEFLTIELAEEI